MRLHRKRTVTCTERSILALVSAYPEYVLTHYKVRKQYLKRKKTLTFKNKRLKNKGKRKKLMAGQGFEPGLLRPQRNVLTTRRSRRAT